MFESVHQPDHLVPGGGQEQVFTVEADKIIYFRSGCPPSARKSPGIKSGTIVHPVWTIHA